MINKRLYKELFAQKNVTYDPQIYKFLYFDIWPCEQYFESFLRTNDSSVKLKYAKKIFQYFNKYNDVIIPDFLIDELIFTQQNDLRKNCGYTPQDHLIHSVNLYILGIYVFFNMDIFHRKILSEYKSKSLFDKIFSFIREWRFYSLYHDIGYVLEANVDENGSIKNKNQIKHFLKMFDKLKHEHATQCVANLVFKTYLISECFDTFLVNEVNVCETNWKSGQDELSGKDVCTKLNEYKNLKQLKYINSLKDFCHIESLLKAVDCIFTYEDKFGVPLIYVLKTKNQEKEIYYNLKYDADKKYPFILKPLLYEDLIFKCYIGNAENSLKNIVKTMFQDEIFQYYSFMPNTIKSKISLASQPDALEYIYHEIYKWLSKEINKDNNEINHVNQSIKRIVTQEISQAIEKKLIHIIEEKPNVSKIIEKVVEILKELDFNNLERMIASYYEDNFGKTEPVKNFHKEVFRSINENIINSNNCIQVSNKKIVFSPFLHENADVLTVNLYDKLTERANKLGIDFKLLEHYKTDYTICDHGVVSASLLYNILVFNEKFVELAKNQPILSFSYNNQSIVRDLLLEDNINFYSKTLFSILLHNIYTSNSRDYGINYKHDIDKDAFSYFCALMDTLQKWDRPKQLDYSVVELPKEHYLDDNYDIVISKYNINIRCSSIFSGNMRKQINALEDYLPGASSLIKLNEIEFYTNIIDKNNF